MYQFKTELKDQLLDGRTIVSMCNKIGISRVVLNNILNGKAVTRKLTAYCIVKASDKEAEINLVIKNLTKKWSTPQTLGRTLYFFNPKVVKIITQEREKLYFLSEILRI